ncbi:cellobiose phosphorylase [Faecalibacterium sp. An58]|uniref:GH36-type glycosyl hydrolase domain-containing protein n=1 Tax=Faecalibacterium sp. An58 TaxID=1965648 RepID=UPI000B3963BD|nr:cellobiose phosphorylase [Faecalibacterium sp. An58]OUN70324.1 cellobiose phosphorylase [Faecalibacterium sp. An58]
MNHLHFVDGDGSFTLSKPENVSYLYFPLASETGMKSSVTPNLGGDAKLDQETFLLEPVSAENLHNNRSVRNFWLAGPEGEVFSAAGASAGQEAARFTPAQDDSAVTAGLMWHTLERDWKDMGLHTAVTTFCPRRDRVEIMLVCVHNRSDQPRRVTPTAAIPLYGRSADNIRDHRNVTSMLHRIWTGDNGVMVRPTMSFDERGHRPNHKIYYVWGCGPDGQKPEGFYPTVEDFLGEGGTYLHPRAVLEGRPGAAAGCTAEGREAMGAFRFPAVTLAPGQKAEYVLLLGVEDSEADIAAVWEKYGGQEKALDALESTRADWLEKVNVRFATGDADFDCLMRWVCFQPFLRRLFGCSFLPHHDYGRGGRGWRDLWQDCLSLLLMDPGGVGRMIEKNFGGVRIDGTNATIIGDGDGNFIADRNGIARVWMDHALWPQMTVKLYIDQTGDVAILNRQAPYFKDAQAMRGTRIDPEHRPEQGCWQRTAGGEVYAGTILEHLLIQQLAAFYEVGRHNIYRLRGADWNDALDMAAAHGESVAFTCAYAGNLRELAGMIRLLQRSTGAASARILEEALVLLNDQPEVLDQVEAKHRVLEQYAGACSHTISGRQVEVRLEDLAASLEKKASWLTAWLQGHEWIDAGDGQGWYNSYYDDHGRAVEGIFPTGVRMMLTGQVFAIMGGVATDAQVGQITRSADRYLYRREIGGYRLNTDFHELKFDLGRMFGFAYGEKENGAVFSHMAVMYANALYRRGFVQEGWKALKSLADTALDFDTSRIYPGIPEYFRADGRGMYHYLTGAASWYMMTMITQAFGVRGEAGDLLLEPKLTAGQFDEKGRAMVSVTFAGRRLTVCYENPERLDYGSYRIGAAACDGAELCAGSSSSLLISRAMVEALPAAPEHRITVTLC